VINRRKILAIIPARGGSKRLPEKNILPLVGKPLIVWTIEAAKKSKYIDCILVSSDDENILNISKEYGVETQKRPEELASDNATSFEAVKHVIESIQEKYEITILLQPTSPLRNEIHIDEGIDRFEAKCAEAVISVSEMDHSPLWANTLSEDGNMSNFIKPEFTNMRSQDLPVYYRINGAIYICDTKKLLTQEKFILDDNIFAYQMPQESSVDIDTGVDFLFAETLLRVRSEQN
jgi:CMP-N,N'-diacetyllegionaminic acid synthase